MQGCFKRIFYLPTVLLLSSPVVSLVSSRLSKRDTYTFCNITQHGAVIVPFKLHAKLLSTKTAIADF